MVLARRRYFSILCTFIVAPASMAAVDQHQPRSIPILRPGSPDLFVAHIRTRSDSFVSLVPDTAHPGTDRAVSGRREVENLVDDPQGPAVVLIQQFPGYVDSAIVLRSNLRPIREVQRYAARHRRLVYEYAGNRVRVRDSTVDSVVKIRDHTYDGDFFHFNQLGLVIRSVPLREGYEAILPLYSEGDDSIEMDTVKVLGKDDRGGWRIRFADPVVFVVQTVDATTRQIVSIAGTQRSTGRTYRSALVK